MANYPFKINLELNNGNQISWFTSSFATDAESLVSASVMVDKINSLKLADEYIQSIEASTVDSAMYGADGEDGIKYLSASFTEPNTGSITFTDTETTSEGGLNFYPFHGTKVCSVLGLPEGIPIYTENFKLSDSSTDTTNYISGEFVSDRVALKRGFKMSPQARMQSNLIWDEVFGEGMLQWVSGSDIRMSMGYDNVNDKYEIQAPTASFNESNISKGTVTTLTTGGIEVANNNVRINNNGTSGVIRFQGPSSSNPVTVRFNNNSTIDGIELNSANIHLLGNQIHFATSDYSTYIQETSNDILDFYVGGDNMLKIDEGNSAITTPQQPAFLVFNSGTDNNLAIDTDVKIEFNSEVYDQASNFDNGTDTFTAPVTGKYLLTTQLRLDDIDTAAAWTSIRITTSNREYRRFIDPNFTSDLNYFGMNMTVVADMDAGDTAHVEFKQSGGTAQVDSDSGNPAESPPQLDTFFSGYLVG